MKIGVGFYTMNALYILGEGSGICEAEGFGNSFFKAVNRIEPTY